MNVEDVPLAGVSASDLVHVIAKATVKQNDARITLVRKRNSTSSILSSNIFLSFDLMPVLTLTLVLVFLLID